MFAHDFYMGSSVMRQAFSWVTEATLAWFPFLPTSLLRLTWAHLDLLPALGVMLVAKTGKPLQIWANASHKAKQLWGRFSHRDEHFWIWAWDEGRHEFVKIIHPIDCCDCKLCCQTKLGNHIHKADPVPMPDFWISPQQSIIYAHMLTWLTCAHKEV